MYDYIIFRVIDMKNRNILIYSFFILYVVIMIWLLFIQRISYINYDNYWDKLIENINIIPFRTISEYLFTDRNADFEIIKHAFVNLAGNIVMFIPLGFFLAYTESSDKAFRAIIIKTILIITAIEIIQLFSLTGSFDIDDLILNTIGSAAGYKIHSIIFKNKH